MIVYKSLDIMDFFLQLFLQNMISLFPSSHRGFKTWWDSGSFATGMEEQHFLSGWRFQPRTHRVKLGCSFRWCWRQAHLQDHLNSEHFIKSSWRKFQCETPYVACCHLLSMILCSWKDIWSWKAQLSNKRHRTKNWGRPFDTNYSSNRLPFRKLD